MTLASSGTVDGIEAKMTEQFDNLQASLDAAGTSLSEVASNLNDAVIEIQALRDEIAPALISDQTATVQARFDALVTRIQAAASIINPEVEPVGGG
jgi:hypothetical protein